MLFIIKTTNRCKLNCEYCYHNYFCRVRHEGRNQTISPEQARVIIKRAGEWANSADVGFIKFLWHGGEPALLDRRFYETILSYQKKLLRRVKFGNSLQTGLSVARDDDYWEFLADNGFSIGLSYDVVNTARDPDRRHYIAIMGNLFKIMRAGSIPSALAIVTPYNVDHANLVFDFFRSHGINFRCKYFKAYTPKHRQISVSVSRYTEFMSALFTLWKNIQFKQIKINDFVFMAKRLRYPKRNSLCVYDDICAYGRVHIAINGDVFPCDGLVDMPGFRYGNIYDPAFSLEGIYRSPVLEKYFQRKTAIEKICSGCEFYANCYGGCLEDSLRSCNSCVCKSGLCPYFKKMFALIKPHAKAILKPIDRTSVFERPAFYI